MTTLVLNECLKIDAYQSDALITNLSAKTGHPKVAAAPT